STSQRLPRDTSRNCSAGGRRAIRRPHPKSGSRGPEADRPGRTNNKETSSCGFSARDRIHWRATPDVIARIDRLHLRREIGADTGPESITPDRQIGALTAVIGEIDVNAAAVLLDTLEHMSEVIALTIDRLQ